MRRFLHLNSPAGLLVPVFVALHLVAAVVGSTEGTVTIDFDDLAPGTVVTLQYPEVEFFSEANVEIQVIALAAAPSPPNLVCTVPLEGGATCVSDLHILFTEPVVDLSLTAIGAKALGVVAKVDVYELDVFTATVDVIGTGDPGVPLVVDLSAFTAVTQIDVHSVTDPAGIGWDDLCFTPLLFADGFESSNTSAWSATVTPILGDVIGRVFEDSDGDGTQNGGELGLPGVDVELTNFGGSMVTATTDANGDYAATVVAGSTTADVVDSTLPLGFFQTAGTDPTVLDVLEGGVTDFGLDGYRPGGEIFGHVFVDSDGDGSQSGGEPDLAGVDVSVTDSDLNVSTVTTDASGSWSLTVPGGNTTADVVEATLPLGAAQTAGSDPTMMVVPVGVSTDFGEDGYQLQTSVFGHLFEDTDASGAQDVGEPDLAGVEVDITDSLMVTTTVVTDATGDFSLIVPTGPTTADVDESTLPMGLVQTAGADPTMVVAVAGMPTSMGEDGYQPRGTVLGRVFEDADGDGGLSMGEVGLVGVEIMVTDSQAVLQTVITDANGDYSANIAAGNTTIDVDDLTLPPGAVLTSGMDPTVIAVPAGSNTDAGLVGYQQQAPVFGHLFEDSDASGFQDVGEPDLGGVSIDITDSLGQTTTVMSDGNGEYGLMVPAGSTIADVDEKSLPVGFVQTSGVDPTELIALPGVPTDLGDDGYQAQATVTGRVFNDVDGDGIDDGLGNDEGGLVGVQIDVTDSQGLLQMVVTDATGDYLVTVAAGNTTVDVDDSTLPVGSVLTAGADPVMVNAPPGSSTDAGTVGYQQQATVFGHLFEDSNGSGFQDMGEPDLGGISIEITDALDALTIVITDLNGDYSLVVPAGETTADVDESTLPAGFVQTAGSDPTIVVAPAGSSTDLGTDGYQPQGTIFGNIFLDLDGDMIDDGSGAGEGGIEFVDVLVTDSLGGMQTVTTDGNGDYSATVVAGTTTIDIDESTLPAGAVLTVGSDMTMLNVPAGSNTDFGTNGYQQRADLFGHAFSDIDASGTQDGGDLDLAGIDVVITDSLGGMQTVTTVANGLFMANVPAGMTTVDIDDVVAGLLGYVLTTGNDTTMPVLVAGSNTDVGEFGFQPRADVFGHVFEDIDGNGMQNGGEPDLPMTSVTVTDSLGVFHDLLTDVDGNYSVNVPAGSTTAEVDLLELPFGYLQTAGTNPTMVVVPVGSNTDLGEDGFQPRADVFGFVFNDDNGDGVYDSMTESGLAGVTVTITDSLMVDHMVVTDVNGDYSMNVPAGATTADVDETTLPPVMFFWLETTGINPSMMVAPLGSNTDMGDVGYQEQGM